MADTRKTKRPGRPRAARDPRLESSPPSREPENPGVGVKPEGAAVGRHEDAGTGPRRAPATRPTDRESVATLEADLARLRGERSADADELADLLVRNAATERARATAEARRDELEGQVRSLEDRTRALEERLALADESDRALRLAEAHTGARVEALLAEGESARERADAAEADLEQIRTGIEGVASDLVSARARVDEYEARAVAAETASASLREELASLGARLAQADGTLGDAQGALQESYARAKAAEALAADRVADVERVTGELDADRARIIDLESKLELLRAARQDDLARSAKARDEELASLAARHASELASLRVRHDEEAVVAGGLHADRLREAQATHAKALAAQRETHVAATRDASAALERERSAVARARQQVALVERNLLASREAVAKLTGWLDEAARVDAAAAEGRAQALSRARELVREATAAADRPAPPPSVASAGAKSELDALEVDLVKPGR